MALYIDASAFVKTVIAETESAALRAFLRRPGGRRVSSALLRAEAIRALRRHGPQALAETREALREVELITVSDGVLDTAGMLDPQIIRTLDAIHLATALSVGQDLDAIVTYDERMAEGARFLGLPVSTPR